MKESKRNFITGLSFVSPWLIGLLVFTLYPLCSSFYISLTRYNIIGVPKFIGLRNYIELFTKDKVFGTVIYNTGYMIIVGVSFTMVVTLLISVLLNNPKLKGLSFYRVVFFIPTLVPTVILSILWIWLFQPNSGLVNGLLGLLHIPGPGWFGSQIWSKPAFVLMAAWCGGNYIIIFLAGLQEIPETMYEAVSIDGGNFLHKFWYITIPMLKPVFLYNIVSALIMTMQSFSESFIITQGGPNNTTNFYSLYLYQNAFLYNRMGYASAMAWILMIAALAITLALIKSMNWGRTDAEG